MPKNKRAVIQHKVTGVKVVVHKPNKIPLSATLVNYILNHKGWQLGNIKIKYLTNTTQHAKAN